MLPVVALVGRPNVGKSTLFNRITRSRDALVANYAGLTRDRKYGEANYAGCDFIVIDTGGISGNEEGIDAAMASQSLQAIEEADIILLLVDARDGLAAADRAIANHLRQGGKTAFLVANKTDGLDPELALLDFYELGLGRPWAVSASHGRGVPSLLDAVTADFVAVDENAPRSSERVLDSLKIAIVGRPNVGKSTLVNRLLGEDRVVVYDQPGTTRDSIYINYERDGKPYTLIDTAGVRKRKNVSLTVEKFSIVKALQAVQDANVVILVMDGQEGIVDQDMHLLGYAIDSGRALVLAVNKWDGLEDSQRRQIRADIDRRLHFVDFAEVHYISALHGSGVGNLYKSIDTAYQAATADLSTPRLTRILQDAVVDHAPPMVNGRRIKMRYAHPGGTNPPIVVIHGNQVDAVPDSYKRYLEKIFRRELKLFGTPVRIQFRSHENPFAGRRNTLTPRQKAKRDRLKTHVRKQKSRSKR
jgi:GTP-binding protein